ncbi:MAG: 6,7-dimethyl-8-ribityllumazine synthase [Alistipes sp.]|nr:6,7-dimethyl-8-ribityllumazine synthase [Alistipes sp.]
MRIGIVMVKEQMSFAQRHLSATTESLKALGCAESDIKIISSPTVLNVPLTTQFFAEYTEVDAVIVLVEPSQSREYETMLYGITRLQMTWNMPVLVGDCTAAEQAVEMVRTQSEMEAAAPDYVNTDHKSVN